MKKLEYKIMFITPAFLGNAERSGQWRTPPFKAQLRQFWRMVWAAKHKYPGSVKAMREAEGKLFGNAWLEPEAGKKENRFCKSQIRIRLDRWDMGKLAKSQWEPCGSVANGKQSVTADIYLGYGPVAGKTLKSNAAIQSGEQATLSLAVPDQDADADADADAEMIAMTLGLMNYFGAVGGRSRNGWGSYTLTALGDTPALASHPISRPWQESLMLDWPNALGRDENGTLSWSTSTHNDWKSVMRELAAIKIGLRAQFSFSRESAIDGIHRRHWISYPVTKHNVTDWDKSNLRLTNSLRFKVRPATDNPTKLVGIIFHMPCLPPEQFRPNIKTIEQVWAQVHSYLDAYPTLTRISA